MIKLKPYFNYSDERGQLYGIIQKGIWKEINHITSSAGSIRGNHYHKKTLELFYIISGTIEVFIKNLRNGKETSFNVISGDIFIVEPYELHTFNIKTDSSWINMLSKRIDHNKPDIYRL